MAFVGSPSSFFPCRCRNVLASGNSVCSWVPGAKISYAAPQRMKIATLVMQAVTNTERKTLQQFLTDAKDLGTIRFVAVSNGAVLETIGRFDYAIKEIDIPGLGKYLTIASVDMTFECHINLSKVSTVTMSKEKAKVGGHDIYVIRLKDEGDGIVLSCLLMWDPSEGPGNYLHGAVDAFEMLQAKYGGSFKVSTA